jgi:hypothetical protein
MKLTEPGVIEKKENELIESIRTALDWKMVRKLITEKYLNSSENPLNFKNGDLVVHNNCIVYKLDFEIQVPLSVVFSREGDCLDIITDQEDRFEKEKIPQDMMEIRAHSSEKVGQLAASIADMINEINQSESSQ